MHAAIIIEVFLLDNIIDYFKLLLKLKHSHAFIIFGVGPDALDNLSGEHREELNPFIQIFKPFIHLFELSDTSSLHTTLVHKTNIGFHINDLAEILLIEELAELLHHLFVLLELAIDYLVHQLLVLVP